MVGSSARRTLGEEYDRKVRKDRKKNRRVEIEGELKSKIIQILPVKILNKDGALFIFNFE
jgi:hypothetical protein